MKTRSFLLAVFGLILLNRGSAADSVRSDLIGEWELVLKAADANRNGKLDPEERANGIKIDQNRDMLEFKSDGTCLVYRFKNRAKYELKARSDGSEVLHLTFDQGGSKENRGIVIRPVGSELVLLSHSSGAMFSVYRKVGGKPKS